MNIAKDAQLMKMKEEQNESLFYWILSTAGYFRTESQHVGKTKPEPHWRLHSTQRENIKASQVYSEDGESLSKSRRSGENVNN